MSGGIFMLLMKDIIKEGHPTLTKYAQELEFPLSRETKQLAYDMLEFIQNSQDDQLAEQYDLRPGVGIAAPQLNHSIQLCAVHVPHEDDREPLTRIFVNPQIISHTEAEIALRNGEGCLSVDRPVEGIVPRSKRITVRYQDLDGKTHKERFRGYDAIVIQHEIDHLRGVLFYDHIDPDDPYRLNSNIELI